MKNHLRYRVPQNGWFKILKTLLKLMIWVYHYFWKHPYAHRFRLDFLRRARIHELLKRLNLAQTPCLADVARVDARQRQAKEWAVSFSRSMGVEPKIMGKIPNHPFFYRVFKFFWTIHFGVFPPIFENTQMVALFALEDVDGWNPAN